VTNISTLPKSGIVNDAEPELAMVEVASAEGDLVVYLGDCRVRNPATSAALA
jgi:hypothetical protein